MAPPGAASSGLSTSRPPPLVPPPAPMPLPAPLSLSFPPLSMAPPLRPPAAGVACCRRCPAAPGPSPCCTPRLLRFPRAPVALGFGLRPSLGLGRRRAMARPLLGSARPAIRSLASSTPPMGKSTLLNQLFGTNFREMDAFRGRSQTTKGIWIARCVGVEPCTIVLDLEATDGRERGEDDIAFEKQSVLFALAISDIVLINMWCHDIGREQAANKPLLKT